MESKSNISQFLPEVAKQYPNTTSITFRDQSITFKELEDLSNYYACEFRKKNIDKGTKTLVMLKPSIEFIAVVFAIFKLRAIPILIDPGMGVKNLLNCIKETEPEAMAGIALAHWVRLPFFNSFKSIKTFISFGKYSPLWIDKMVDISSFMKSGIHIPFDIEKGDLDDTAAILFTTGSTGPPKGVVYTHRIYIKQMQMIQALYKAGPEQIDMPAFPLFALFSAAMGMPCVIPDINPSLPAKADPKLIIDTITKHNITFSFASPALWLNLANHCVKNKIKLPTLKKILMAGAPVPPTLHKLLKEIAPNCETMVPYGATEALPVANFSGSDLTEETANDISNGKGYCVGKPFPDIDIFIIEATDSPIEKWDKNLILPQGETGEIVIHGDVVTPKYYNLPTQTLNAKITHTDGTIMHRMGDIGYFDKEGRLWFKGRKAHRVILSSGEILYPVCCEAIFNAHTLVDRSALVGVGEKNNQTPIIIIEPNQSIMPLSTKHRDRLIGELKEMGYKHEFTQKIDKFYFYSPFPVDIRHNAKIFREKLAEWAENLYNKVK